MKNSGILNNSYDIHLKEPIQVSEICQYTKEEQAELIADIFSKISQEYDALKTSDILVPSFTRDSIPHISQLKVKNTLKHIKKNINNTRGYSIHSSEKPC